MSMLRTTGTFTNQSPDAAAASDAAAVSPSQASAQQDREGMWPSEDTAASERVGLGRESTYGVAGADPLATPRATLVPAGRSTGASLRPSARATQSLAAPNRAADIATSGAQQELAARARELFAALREEVQQWAAQLAEFCAEKAPRKASKDFSAARLSLRSHLAELTAVAKTADAGRRGASCLPPEHHRQIFEYTQALNAFESRLSGRAGPQLPYYSAEDALLDHLRKGLKLEKQYMSHYKVL